MSLRKAVSKSFVETLDSKLCEKVYDLLQDRNAGYSSKRKVIKELNDICTKKFIENLNRRKEIENFYKNQIKENRRKQKYTTSVIVAGTRYYIKDGYTLDDLLMISSKIQYVFNHPLKIYKKREIYPSYIVVLQERAAYQFDPLSTVLGTIEFLYNFEAFEKEYKGKGIIPKYKNGSYAEEFTVCVPSKLQWKGKRIVRVQGLSPGSILKVTSSSDLSNFLSLKKIYRNGEKIYPDIFDEYVVEVFLLLNTLDIGISENLPLPIIPTPKYNALIALLNLYKAYAEDIYKKGKIPRLKFFIGMEIMRYYNDKNGIKTFDSPRIWTKGYAERLKQELHPTKIEYFNTLKMFSYMN